MTDITVPIGKTDHIGEVKGDTPRKCGETEMSKLSKSRKLVWALFVLANVAIVGATGFATLALAGSIVIY